MSQQAATIESLPVALAMVKATQATQAGNLDFGEDYRPFARQAFVTTANPIR